MISTAPSLFAMPVDDEGRLWAFEGYRCHHHRRFAVSGTGHSSQRPHPVIVRRVKTIIAEVHQNFGKTTAVWAQALSRLQQTLPEVQLLHFLDSQILNRNPPLERSAGSDYVLETETLVSFLNHRKAN